MATELLSHPGGFSPAHGPLGCPQLLLPALTRPSSLRDARWGLRPVTSPLPVEPPALATA